MTTFAEWREYGENLGRFASVREKAESPMDRIVIQNKDGVQKVIAGDHGKTLIVTVGPTNQPNGRAVVGSRLFLTTLKTLKGKGSAEIRLTETGAVIQAVIGDGQDTTPATISFDNISSFFKFLTPQVYKSGTGHLIRLPEGFFPDASKYLAGTGDYNPLNQVLGVAKNHQLYFRANDDHIEAKAGPIEVDDDFRVHFPDHVFPALKGLEHAGGIWIAPHKGPQVHQAQFFSGPYRVVSVIYPNYGVYPEVAQHEYTAIVTGDKKVLIDTFKSLAGRHEYSYSVMEADGGKFTVRSGGSGAASPNVDCVGTGSLPVNAAFMAKVLQTVDGKTATVEFADSPSAVRVTGDKNNWPILIAAMDKIPGLGRSAKPVKRPK